jgi:hypothetical protein
MLGMFSMEVAQKRSSRPAVKKMRIMGLENREAFLLKMIFGYLSAYLIYGAPPILLSRARICKPF